MIANETTLHKRTNDTEINNYRSPYGLQQCTINERFVIGYYDAFFVRV